MAARAKKVDPLKAKEAKQKKIAIGGMVLLCALIAIQGPKTLKMLQGPQPVTTAAPSTTTPTETTPTAPASGGEAPAAPGAAPAAAPELAAVADSDPAPAPAPGDLVTFERFESKDPFAPQVEAAPPAPPAPAGDAGGEGGAAAPGDGEGGGDSGADGGFTPAPTNGSGSAGGSASPTPPAPTLATATSISVNGTAEDVAVDAQFPAAEPTFVLVSLAKDGKSVEIGVAGGTYANGEPTITLELGEPLTLQNTADGSRYELELLTVLGFPLPKK